MGLTISFKGGDRAGQSQTFDDNARLITIGRDPARCQIVFPAEDARVGRVHCELALHAGRYRLNLNHANPVSIDGREAMDQDELPATCDLQLGKDGPVLVLEQTSGAGLAPTIRQGPGPRGQGTVLRQAERTARTGRTIGVIAVLLLAAVSVYFLTRDIEQTRKMRELTDQQRDLLATTGTKFEQVQARTEEQRPLINDVLIAARPSVYMVLLRFEGGDETGHGTAWVAGADVLGTNAHVADVFQHVGSEVPGMEPLGKLQQVIARSNDTDPKEFVIREVKIHPGYETFSRLWRQFRPAYGTSADKLQMVEEAGGACDVALMYVENPEGLAPPLQLANDDTLHALDAGDPVGFVGYPMEGIGTINLKRPTPTVQIAHLTAVTDFFGSNARDEQGNNLGQLVQHALPAAGGASGSPILNADGQVIALLNATNMVFIQRGDDEVERTPAAVGINYAMRSDLLREMLEGDVEQIQADRTAFWQQRLTEEFTSGTQVVRETVVEQYREKWITEMGGESRFTATPIVDLTGKLGEPGRGVQVPFYRHALPAQTGGAFFVIAVASGGEDIDLLVVRPTSGEAEVLVKDEAYDFYPLGAYELASASPVEIFVVGPEKDIEFELHVFHAAPVGSSGSGGSKGSVPGRKGQ